MTDLPVHRIPGRPVSSRLRRSLSAGACAVLVVGLSACGFDYPTDRVNTLTNGISERSASVDVLNSVIVSSEAGRGTVVATLSNNDQEPVDLLEISGAEDGLEVASAERTLLARAGLNLANPGPGNEPIGVAGDFVAGEFVDLVYTFSTGETVTVTTHVVSACEEYEGLDTAAPVEAQAQIQGGILSTEGEAVEPENVPDLYDCEYATLDEE